MRRIWVAFLVLAFGCHRNAGHAGTDSAASLEERRKVWEWIQPLAAREGIDPGFVYALVRVESDFNPRAHRGENRGLLQMKERLWKSATQEAYDPGVWDPRENLEVGIRVLAAMKARLTEKGVFSYPVLWACYHYGEDAVASHGYDPSRLPRPSDPVELKLRSGDIHPIEPPK